MSDEEATAKPEDLEASTKRLADWTFSLQGVGADLKNLMNEFKAYWRSLVPALEGPMNALVPEAKEIPTRSQGSITVTQGSSSATVEISDRTLSVIAFGFAVAAFVIALWAIRGAQTAANELKQVQIQLMYANAIMLREGIVQPGDMVYGPEGNLEYKQHQLKPQEHK